MGDIYMGSIMAWYLIKVNNLGVAYLFVFDSRNDFIVSYYNRKSLIFFKKAKEKLFFSI